VVYQVRTGPLLLRGKYGCAFARGEKLQLDNPDPRPHEYSFPLPALSLSGTVVGWAEQVLLDVNEGPFVTLIRVKDLAHPESFVRDVPAGSASLLKVGSLRARANGAVAWIACREPDHSNPRGLFSPTCERPGHLDRVYKLDSGSDQRVTLDSGRAIDPHSLRRQGSKISWLDGGRLRHATLR
jgi:hypothetical protein